MKPEDAALIEPVIPKEVMLSETEKEFFEANAAELNGLLIQLHANPFKGDYAAVLAKYCFRMGREFESGYSFELEEK